METKKCAKCGQYKPINAFSLAYKGICKECRNEIERERRSDNESSRQQADNAKSNIDWEMRQYNLASDIFSRMMVALNEDNEKCGFRAAVKNTALSEGKSETRYIADEAIGQASHFVRRYKEKLNNEDKNGKEDS